MTITVSEQEFQNRFGELLSLARGGMEVVVQEPDKQELKLVPVHPIPSQTPRREWVFNLHPGAWVMSEDFDDPIDEEDFLKGDL